MMPERPERIALKNPGGEEGGGGRGGGGGAAHSEIIRITLPYCKHGEDMMLSMARLNGPDKPAARICTGRKRGCCSGT